MSESPLDQAKLPAPEDDSESLRRELEGIALRGRDSERLVGDVKAARTLNGLFRKYGSKYKGAEEFEKDLLPLVTRKMKEYADVDPQAAAVYMNVGLKATHQNAQAEERLMKLAGLGHKEEEGGTVNISVGQMNIQKALTITDNRTGAHARDNRTQELLLELSESIFDANGQGGGTSIPALSAMDMRTRKDADASSPSPVVQNTCPNDHREGDAVDRNDAAALLEKHDNLKVAPNVVSGTSSKPSSHAGII